MKLTPEQFENVWGPVIGSPLTAYEKRQNARVLMGEIVTVLLVVFLAACVFGG